MIRVENYLKNGNVLAGVDDPAVHGVGTGEVDHLAQHHSVVRLGVHVAPVAGQGQLVGHVAVALEGVVDPVGEGDLLLLEHGVVRSELSLNLLSFLVVLLRRLEGFGDVVSLERLAELGESRM